MKTRTKILSLIVIFAALATVLNLVGPKIPYPFAPFLYYQLWEIPIVIAFLLVGLRSGKAVTIINTLILVIVFPGPLPTGPFYNLAAVLSMMLGVYMPYLIAKQRCKAQKFDSYLMEHKALIIASATGLGIGLRVMVMTVVNYFALQQTYPIGYGLLEPAAVAFLPIGAIFNATLALYTIPTAFLITLAIMSSTKLQ